MRTAARLQRLGEGLGARLADGGDHAAARLFVQEDRADRHASAARARAHALRVRAHVHGPTRQGARDRRAELALHKGRVLVRLGILGARDDARPEQHHAARHTRRPADLRRQLRGILAVASERDAHRDQQEPLIDG